MTRSADPLRPLRRVRLLAWLTLAVGVAASIAANVLHARHNPISQAIAAWPPLALLLTVELVSRVPVHRRTLATIRILATGAIAAIAAWVSYWHMAAVASRYGEHGPSARLLPLCVDGLVVAATISLVELAGRIRTLQAATQPAARRPRAAKAATTATGARRGARAATTTRRGRTPKATTTASDGAARAGATRPPAPAAGAA